MKTPEELAEECKNKIAQRDIYAMGTLTQREQDYLKEAFLAGYHARDKEVANLKEEIAMLKAELREVGNE
jgi:predicted DNA binding protein